MPDKKPIHSLGHRRSFCIITGKSTMAEINHGVLDEILTELIVAKLSKLCVFSCRLYSHYKNELERAIWSVGPPLLRRRCSGPYATTNVHPLALVQSLN